MNIARERGQDAPAHRPMKISTQQTVIIRLAAPNILKVGRVKRIFSASILSVNTSYTA